MSVVNAWEDGPLACQDIVNTLWQVKISLGCPESHNSVCSLITIGPGVQW